MVVPACAETPTTPTDLSVADVPLADCLLGTPCHVELTAVGDGGEGVWSIIEGRLPAGLTRSGATISGEPTEAGFFPITVQVSAGGASAVGSHRVRVYESELTADLLPLIPDYLLSSIQYAWDLLPRNPQHAEALQAKIALLSDPDLEAKILNGKLYAEGEASALDGRLLARFIVFPADTMREGAQQDFQRTVPAVSSLEAWLQVPWPHSLILEWYGFRMGHTGGGGTLHMEDRGTYAERAAPHDAILVHELAHTYAGHEGLTQFMEMYVYNLTETGSADVSEWIWVRGDYVAFAEGNTGSWVLMDIHTLLGPVRMGRAVARLHAMGTRYGEPLSAEARQVFVDEAPDDAKAVVATLVPRI